MTVREIKASTTDPDAGLFHKSEKERCFAYSLHTVCDAHGFVLGTEVTPGNVHDSVMLRPLIEQISKTFGKPTHVAADAGYKTPFNCRYLLTSGILPAMPYTRPKGKSELIPIKEFIYDDYNDCYLCPENHILPLGTIDREGYRIYRSEKKVCRACPRLKACTQSQQAQKVINRHIWRDYLDETDHLRHTADIKMIYRARKETIERVFADGKEKHGMRYTHYRGLRKVTHETFLLFACMNLKKLIGILTRKGQFPEGGFRFLPDYLRFSLIESRKPSFSELVHSEKLGLSSV